MPAVRNRGQIAQKWQRKAAAAAPDYSNGIANPREDWATKTAQSSQAWAAGVQRAAANNSFQSGVQEAGTEKWKRNAMQKGPARFAQGVQAAQQDYAQGVNKYLDVIESTQLPPRGPKGDPSNIERVRVLAEKLHQAKQGGR